MSELLDLVESLQDNLTTPNGSLQKDAFKKLNDVFHIVDFYVSRLIHSDPNLIGILLDGLLWFADNQLLTAECAVKICNDGFFSTLSIHSLRKEERRIACRLLHALLSSERTRTGLISMKPEFIRGFIVSVENEKDPECLMSVFLMHPLVLKFFNLAHLAEDHFDIMAAYFPVDYNPSPGSLLRITRAHLAERLRAALFASRHIDGNFLLPLLLEKVTSYRPEARTDSLALLADCVSGVLNADCSFTDFQSVFPSDVDPDPIPIVHVTAYLFALCNMVRQLTTEMDASEDAEDVNKMLCFVAGLTALYKGKPEEQDFTETFLKCLWPEKQAGNNESIAAKLDSWFAVSPGDVHATPMEVPEALVTDCLLTAVLANIEGPLLPRLFRRLAGPLLWPRVDSLPAEDCFYQAKFEQITLWTPHFSLLNRILSHVSRVKGLSLDDLRMKEEDIYAITFNLSHTLKRACSDLRMCANGEDSKRDLAEIAIFSLLCRLMSLLKFSFEKEGEETGKAFLDICPHVLEHMLPDKAGDSVLRALRFEQQNLLAKLITDSSLVADGLQLLLFKSLEYGSSVEYEGIAIEVLQRAACGSRAILNNFLTLLFGRCIDSISLTPTFQLVSAILFITRSLRRSGNDDILSFLASTLQQHSDDFINLTIRLIGDLPDKSAKSCLADLLSATRLISSSLSMEEQAKAFTSFMEFIVTAEVSNPYVALLLDCAIISALHPTLPDFPLGDILNLLSDYFAIIINDGKTTNSTLKSIAFSELSVCAATMINKFPDKEVPETLLRIIDSLLAALRADPDKSLALLASRFVVITLRGLLISQLKVSPERQQLIDRLLNILLTTSADYKFDLQVACLLHSIHLLLFLPESEETELEELEAEGMKLDEEVTHCSVNALAIQKCFCLVGICLRTAWQDLRSVTDPSAEQIVLEEAFLHGYLRLVSLLPDNILELYAAGALEAAVLGVVGEARRAFGAETQALCLKVIARMAAAQRSSSSSSNTSSVPLLSSPDAADDFLEKLAALKLTCSATGSSASTSSLRFNLARCLRFLVDLPQSVMARHRGSVRRLLEDLLDDDCQSVRLEAARANNEWYLKV
ncbi:hypothetical protein Aperf_G00000033015 [Anoplocephala perfoliata]